MDTLDAQCYLMQLAAEDDHPGPDLWRHTRDGWLTWAFRGGSGGDYSWSPPDVAEVAERWRSSGATEVPAAIAGVVDVHRRFTQLAEEENRPTPDVVIHDLGVGEVRAVWHEPKLVVIVDEIPAAAGVARPPTP